MTYRPLYEIAHDIMGDWGGKMHFGAVPYVDAMTYLTGMDDRYGGDNAQSIVTYFLGNANTWRGPKAREIKAELRVMLAETNAR